MIECVEFPGYKTAEGYGQKWFDGKLHYAHRVAYCQHHGVPINQIAGQVVMHRCDNPSCVNPTHLELGTIQDNNQDKKDKGRDKYHSRRVLNAAQVQRIRDTCVPGHPTQGYRALARELGCTMGTVQKIYTGKTYL